MKGVEIRVDYAVKSVPSSVLDTMRYHQGGSTCNCQQRETQSDGMSLLVFGCRLFRIYIRCYDSARVTDCKEQAHNGSSRKYWPPITAHPSNGYGLNISDYQYV